jgi:hypothetical protein
MELNALPQGTPLMAKTSEATRLFGMSRTTLYRLRRDHKDFNALTITVGGILLFDVPRCYKWLQQYAGGEVD